MKILESKLLVLKALLSANRFLSKRKILILNRILIKKSQILFEDWTGRVCWQVQRMQSSDLSLIMCVIPITPSGSLGISAIETSAKPARAKRGQRIPGDSMDIPRKVSFHGPLGFVSGVFKP